MLSEVSFTVGPGEVLLVTGASGSGKSSLLELLRGSVTPDMGELRLPEGAKVATLQPIRSSEPLIEHFSDHGVGVAAALELLGWVGLSDAFVYLKRFEDLSAGQQYRAMLAGLLAQGANVWVADEFCANLDPITASVVASRAQQLARRLGAALVAATAHPENILSSLMPDHVVQLTTATETRLFVGSEYQQLLAPPSRHYSIRALAVTSGVVEPQRNPGN